MKSLFVFLLLGAAVLIHAAPPETVERVKTLVEQRTAVWKASAVTPLSETVKEPFAKDGWRIEFQRPLESRSKEGIQGVLNPGDPRNTAEMIFLACDPDPEKVRGKLTWLSEPGELFTKPVFLGKKWQYNIFLRADVATIAAIRNLILPNGGDDVYAVYAEVLNMADYNDTSRRAAARLLPAGGNHVIPMINRAIGIAITNEVNTSPHFVALKGIGTPEAAKAFAAAMRSKFPDVVRNAEDALVTPPALKGAEELYLSMLRSRKHTEECLSAIDELGCQKKAVPIIGKLLREPESFQEYSTLVFADHMFRNGTRKVDELELTHQMRLLTARVGDIPGTPKYISVSDKAANMEMELAAAERERIAPLEKQFLQSKNTDCAICSAVLLCLFNPKHETYSKAYLKRVNDLGLRLLKGLPRARVRSVLRMLRDSVDNQKESDFFRKLLSQIG